MKSSTHYWRSFITGVNPNSYSAAHGPRGSVQNIITPCTLEGLTAR